MKKYLFMVDHKLRDIISLSIIKDKLEKKGNTVFFCRNGMELPVAIKKKVDTVILTQVLTEEWKTTALNLKKFGCNVVSLPSEGNPYIETGKMELASGKYLGYDLFLDMIFTWRKKMFDLTKKFNEINHDKIVYSGFQRLISYTNKYKNFRKKLCRNYREKNKINILFVSNFVGADYYDYPNKKYQKEINKTLAKKESEHRKTCIKFVKEMVFKNSDLNFIIKIHPYEKPDIWIDNFKGLEKNFKISVGDYIEGVIEQSDIIIGRNCHTLSEALVMKKFIINLSFQNDPWQTTLKGENVKYPTLKKFSDFESFLRSYKNRSKQLNKKNQTLEDFRFKNGKIDSVDIIVKNLEKLNTKSKDNLDFFFKLKQLIKYYIFVKNDYLIHDFFYLKNKKKKIINNQYYVDYRYRVDKHYHKSDIDFILKILPK